MLRSSIEIVTLNNPRLYLKLFDVMIKPMLLYGAKVWSQQLVQVFSRDGLSGFDTYGFEQLLNRVCKQILGVRKFTTNLAARMELGMLPLTFCIISRCLYYLAKLEKASED